MSKKKNLTVKEFEQIKLLLQTGLATNKIATLTGRSWTTIKNAQRFDTLKEMRAFQTESRKKYRPLKLSKDWKEATTGRVYDAFTSRQDKEKALDVLVEIRDLLKEMKDKKTGLFR